MNRPEQDLQIKIIATIRIAFPEIEGLIFHNPNGANQGRRMGGILKAMGRISGVPDLALIWNGQTYWIELKADKGSLSAEQKHLHKLWLSHGVSVLVVRSVYQMVEAIEAITGLKSKIKFAEWQKI